jgi:hypothetical protein
MNHVPKPINPVKRSVTLGSLSALLEQMSRRPELGTLASLQRFRHLVPPPAGRSSGCCGQAMVPDRELQQEFESAMHGLTAVDRKRFKAALGVDQVFYFARRLGRLGLYTF